MFKNEMVQMLIDLENNGVSLFLTEEGWKKFITLLMQEDYVINDQQEKVI